MREIEFRAKVAGADRWIYGLPHKVYEQNKIDSIQQSNCNIEYIAVDTLGQFTGFKDRNGIKIYEGDLIGIEGEFICKVEFLDGSFNLVHPNITPTEWSPRAHVWGSLQRLYEISVSIRKDDIWIARVYRVIGNIHDNPELLEQIKNKEQ